MGDRFLEPRKDFKCRSNRLLCEVTVHLVAKANVDTAVPKPPDLYVDFAVIDLLQFESEVHIGTEQSDFILTVSGS